MSNRYLRLLTAAAVIAFAVPANAADPPTKDCVKIEDYRAMVDCFATDSQAADTTVMRVYEAVLAKIGPSPRRGGSFQPTTRNICQIDLTRAPASGNWNISSPAAKAT